MPQVDLIPEVYYDALDPYHYLFDNIPLRNIVTRISLVNSSVDTAYDILNSAIGTQGTLDNRLAQSIAPDGSLLSAAVDDTLHNIGYHTDGTGPDSVAYVRMKQAESTKLSLVADGATNVKLQFDTGGGTYLFDSDTIEFQDSSGITWAVSGGNKVKANLGFPVSAAHTHVYDAIPVDSGDHKNFQTASVSTPFIDGTLRVYVNGTRISSSVTIYVPVGASRTLTLLSFTSNSTAGTFALSTAITTTDVITVDFDRSYT